MLLLKCVWLFSFYICFIYSDIGIHFVACWNKLLQYLSTSSTVRNLDFNPKNSPDSMEGWELKSIHVEDIEVKKHWSIHWGGVT